MKNTWAPLFSKIVDSSLWSEPDTVRIVFITMLALKDSDHVVRYSAYALAGRAHKTEAEVLDALKVLSEPDTRRLEPQPFDGRRIEKVEDGWKILNGQAYEELMRKVSRKIYQARWARDHRKKKPGGGTLAEQHYVKALEEGELDASNGEAEK